MGGTSGRITDHRPKTRHALASDSPVQRTAAPATGAAPRHWTGIANTPVEHPSRAGFSRGPTLSPLGIPTTASPASVLQAKWVVRGGNWIWIEHGHDQKGDAVPEQFAQKPEIILGAKSDIPADDDDHVPATAKALTLAKPAGKKKVVNATKANIKATTGKSVINKAASAKPPLKSKAPKKSKPKNVQQVSAKFAADGAVTVSPRKKPPDHNTMKSEREQQGRALRTRLLQSPVSIDSHADQLASLAKTLESVNGNSLPDDHEGKIKALIGLGNKRTKGDFRKIEPSQDEFTASSLTTSFLAGLDSAGNGEKPSHTESLYNYTIQAARVMSTLRAPTNAIVAPVEHDGRVTGQQHPTDGAQPDLDDGGSGHSFNDRFRGDKQVQVFRQTSADPNAPPNAVFNAANFASTLAILHHMTLPWSASNVGEFDNARRDEQTGERDRIKMLANILGKSIGIPAIVDNQDLGAPVKLLPDRPTSPFRDPDVFKEAEELEKGGLVKMDVVEDEKDDSE